MLWEQVRRPRSPPYAVLCYNLLDLTACVLPTDTIFLFPCTMSGWACSWFSMTISEGLVTWRSPSLRYLCGDHLEATPTFPPCCFAKNSSCSFSILFASCLCPLQEVFPCDRSCLAVYYGLKNVRWVKIQWFDVMFV